MVAITSSSIVCAIGALYGIYVMIRHLKIIRHDVSTGMIYAFPIVCGTLAWASAAYSFYAMNMMDHTDAPMIAMLVSWCMLAGQYRKKYAACQRRKQR